MVLPWWFEMNDTKKEENIKTCSVEFLRRPNEMAWNVWWCFWINSCLGSAIPFIRNQVSAYCTEASFKFNHCRKTFSSATCTSLSLRQAAGNPAVLQAEGQTGQGDIVQTVSKSRLKFDVVIRVFFLVREIAWPAGIRVQFNTVVVEAIPFQKKCLSLFWTTKTIVGWLSSWSFLGFIQKPDRFLLETRCGFDFVAGVLECCRGFLEWCLQSLTLYCLKQTKVELT